MYSIEDILILGDSFCMFRENSNDWPVHLTKLLTGKENAPRGRGFGGASWWSVRKCLLEELDKTPVKLLVMCHTEPMRLWSEENLPLNYRTLVQNQDERSLTLEYVYNARLAAIKNAGKLYYENLLDRDFHEWARDTWFKELEEIIERYQIEKVIHLHCFNKRFLPKPSDHYVFKYGITVSTFLHSRAVYDPIYRNHFTNEVNIELAEKIYKAIETYTKPGLVDIHF